MRSMMLLAALGMVAMVAACQKEDAEAAQREVICEASILDAFGATVAMMQDTVSINVAADSVVGDPRPCKVVLQPNGALVMNGSDSVIGTVKP